MDARAQMVSTAEAVHGLAHITDSEVFLANQKGKLKDYSGELTTMGSSERMQTSLESDGHERDMIHTQECTIPRCHCEKVKHGVLSEEHRRLHHRHRSSSQTLKFSIIMGHI